MYQPGDYVVGYPNFFFDNGIKHTLLDGKILGAENRELLINQCSLEYIFKAATFYYWGDGPDDEGIQEMNFRDLKGLVVEVDTLGEEKPHENGAVRVLLNDKILWFWARNVRPLRLATGGLK